MLSALQKSLQLPEIYTNNPGHPNNLSALVFKEQLLMVLQELWKRAHPDQSHWIISQSLKRLFKRHSLKIPLGKGVEGADNSKDKAQKTQHPDI